MAKELDIDAVWREACVDYMKTMTNAEFDELIAQRERASRPAPRAEDLPTAPPPPMSAAASISAKREQARRLGRTAL